LVAASAIGHNSYALAGMNNEIYLFSFYQGTVVKQLNAAHDDYITSMLFKQVVYDDRSVEQLLITTSAD